MKRTDGSVDEDVEEIKDACVTGGEMRNGVGYEDIDSVND